MPTSPSTGLSSTKGGTGREGHGVGNGVKPGPDAARCCHFLWVWVLPARHRAILCRAWSNLVGLCPVPTLTRLLSPFSPQEAGENAGPVQGPDEGCPARGQGRPQEPPEEPAPLRRFWRLCLHLPRPGNTLRHRGAVGQGLQEWRPLGMPPYGLMA